MLPQWWFFITRTFYQRRQTLHSRKASKATDISFRKRYVLCTLRFDHSQLTHLANNISCPKKSHYIKQSKQLSLITARYHTFWKPDVASIVSSAPRSIIATTKSNMSSLSSYALQLPSQRSSSYASNALPLPSHQANINHKLVSWDDPIIFIQHRGLLVNDKAAFPEHEFLAWGVCLNWSGKSDSLRIKCGYRYRIYKYILP